MELREHPDNLSAFRRGDKAVLTALYKAHVDVVSALVWRGFSFQSQGRMIRFRGVEEPSQLQEIVQEIFLKAFKEASRQAYDDSRSFRPYLLGIARNHIIDEVRKAQTAAKYFVPLASLEPSMTATSTRDPQEVLAASDGPGELAESPERQAIRGQLQRSLAVFMKALEPVESQLVEQHLLGSLGQEEIAQQLGISRNDVRKHIRLIRERLLKHLKAEGFIQSLEVAELFKGGLVGLVLMASVR